MKTIRFTLLLLFASMLVSLSGQISLRAEEVAKCPIMTEDDVEAGHSVDVAGQKVPLCCGKCERLWSKNSKYYIKAAMELKLLPQLVGKEKELELDKVTLMDQRFCPFHSHDIVTPDSPSVDYKGTRVYFFSQGDVDRWNKDPDKNAKEAVGRGLLPQLKGKI